MMKPTLLSTIAVLLALCVPHASSARIVLLAAQGPNAGKYMVGSLFPDNKEFDLKNGDVLTVLDGTGTRVLRGPFKGRLGKSATTRVSPVSLRDVVAASDEKRWRIAAVRALSGDAAEAVTKESRKRIEIGNLWQLELGYQGDWCMRAADDAVIIRKQPSVGEELRVIDEAGTESRTRWRANDEVAPWPAIAPPADGGTYTIATDSVAPSQVTFHLLDIAPGEVPDIARYFLEHNCFSQIDFLASASK